MARKNKTKRTAVRRNHDLGTPETRRRLTPDPLLSSNLETHRAQAALAIREALEDGLGARGLDIVRIGMGGGASNGERDFIPTTSRNLANRACLKPSDTLTVAGGGAPRNTMTPSTVPALGTNERRRKSGSVLTTTKINRTPAQHKKFKNSWNRPCRSRFLSFLWLKIR